MYKEVVVVLTGTDAQGIDVVTSGSGSDIKAAYQDLATKTDALLPIAGSIEVKDVIITTKP